MGIEEYRQAGLERLRDLVDRVRKAGESLYSPEKLREMKLGKIEEVENTFYGGIEGILSQFELELPEDEDIIIEPKDGGYNYWEVHHVIGVSSEEIDKYFPNRMVPRREAEQKYISIETMDNIVDRLYLNHNYFASILGISPPTIHNRIKDGKLKAINPWRKGQPTIHIVDALEYLEEYETLPKITVKKATNFLSRIAGEGIEESKVRSTIARLEIELKHVKGKKVKGISGRDLVKIKEKVIGPKHMIYKY